MSINFSAIPPLNAAAVLKRHGLRADKRLGQNFLQDPLSLEKIVTAAELSQEDTVLEIGPGLGSLTRYLAHAARRVVAIELDERLIAPIRTVLADYSNVELVHGDVLAFPPADLVRQDDYVVVANIPYYITSAIIRHLLDEPSREHNAPRPRRIVLTIQREVAERVCAAAGDMSLLALSVQVFGKPSIAARIPASAFYPAPDVESAVLVIEIHEEPLIAPEALEKFFRLAKAGFAQKRKKLRNSLSSGLARSPAETEGLLQRAGIDPQRRAETLSIPEWEQITKLESGD